MLFTVGIEPPVNDSEAWGIIVPVFEKIGYGCFFASDEESDILYQAKCAILEMTEEAINDGQLVYSMKALSIIANSTLNLNNGWHSKFL